MTADDYPDYPDDLDEDDFPDPEDRDGSEPVGSCEWCESNIYHDDFDGLCEQCAYLSEQSERDARPDPKTGE